MHNGPKFSFSKKATKIWRNMSQALRQIAPNLCGLLRKTEL